MVHVVCSRVPVVSPPSLPFMTRSYPSFHQNDLQTDTRASPSDLVRPFRCFLVRRPSASSYARAWACDGFADSRGLRARATHPFQPPQYYPANINTSRCCDQPICTECFVQIKRAEATATHLVRFLLPCAAEGGGGALVWFRGRPGIVDTDSTPSQHLSFVRSFGGPQESEPACCPFCMEPNFGILYDRPRVRLVLCCSLISRLLRQSPDRLFFTDWLTPSPPTCRNSAAKAHLGQRLCSVDVVRHRERDRSLVVVYRAEYVAGCDRRGQRV